MTEAIEKAEKVCFRVDGDWLADFARTRFDEGAWDRALTLLTDSLEGLTTDQAILILKGEATLTGDSVKGVGFKKLPANGKLAKARRARMEFMYGDIFRLGDKLWKPYGVVSGWDRNDYAFALTFPAPYNIQDYAPKRESSIGNRGYAAAFRSLYYAKDPHKDMLVVLEPRCMGGNVDVYTGDILCEQVNASIPFWYKIPTNEPVKSIEAILAKKTLAVYGAFEGLSYTKNRDEEPGVNAAVEVIAEEAERLQPTGSFSDKGEEKMAEVAGQKLWADLLLLTKQYLEKPTTDYADLRKMDSTFERGVDVLHKHISNDEWDVVEVLRDKFTAERERLLGEQVRAQAEQHGGFIELPLMKRDGTPFYPKTLRVPKNPFLRWCMRYLDFTAHGHEDPVWNFVSPTGLKMYNDDQYHTDWMLGANIPLSKAYDRAHKDDEQDELGAVVRSSSYSYRSVLVKQYTGHQFVTLTKGDSTYIRGEICFPAPNERVRPGSIAVVPHAGPEYQLAMETANMEDADGRRGCIICEVGGKLAHLVLVGREYKCTVLMMPCALKTYKKGDSVTIDILEGTIINNIL